MSATNLNYIPPIDSTAGSCLTMANWQELGVSIISHSLENLLAKPGLDILMEINHIGEFLGWQGEIVLNAMTVKAKSGSYILKSPYDGSAIIIPTETVLKLIRQLRPTYVLLPPDCKWEDRDWLAYLGPIQPFFHALTPATKAGVYFINMFDLTTLTCYKDHPRYVAGVDSRLTLKLLVEAGIEHVECDQIAADAVEGVVYTKTEPLNLRDPAMANQHQIIENNCRCPTCSQQFTCAYLHHLLEHTPLLAQRLIVSHNVYRACS